MVFHNLFKKQYWYIAKRLSTAQLQREPESGLKLSDEDFFNLDIGNRGHDYFLGYYSKSGLDLVFKKYGVYREFAQRGFRNIDFMIDTIDPYRHRLTVYDVSRETRRMLVELILKKSIIKINMPFKTALNGKEFETLAIEWLCMQNPDAPFTGNRPQYPGQNHPGLGMASRAVELLLISAWRLNMAGLVNIPDHYHNAYLYSRIFHYIQPQDEARLRAMARDLKDYDLHTIAWAMMAEAVTDSATGKPVQWFVAKQITPLDEGLKGLFNSRIYRNTIKESCKQFHYELNEEKYNQYISDRRNK